MPRTRAQSVQYDLFESANTPSERSVNEGKSERAGSAPLPSEGRAEAQRLPAAGGRSEVTSSHDESPGAGEVNQSDADLHLSLEQNLAIMAGAGAGKTHNLVGIALHLLAGAGPRDAPLSPRELCILTFTDKAAAELQQRLRQRLAALVEGRTEGESELAAALRSRGRPFPSPEAWRRLHDDLGSASIGTFHSLCAQLLRQGPVGPAVDPRFEFIDEVGAERLVLDVAHRLVLDALEARQVEVEELCSELTLSGEGRAPGLVRLLCSTFAKVREEGVAPLDVPLSDEREARAAFEELVGEASRWTRRADALLPLRLKADFGPVLAQCAEALDGMTVENLLQTPRYPALLRALDSQKRRWSRQVGELGEALKELARCVRGRGGQPGLVGAFGAVRVIPYEQTVRQLLEQLQQRYRQQLDQRGVLDFAELLIRCRDLLRDRLDVRAEVQRRFRALLVDEFQDTNRLQLELVVLLAERRAGGPRPVSRALAGDSSPSPGRESELLALPLEPAFLCAVGDRKQSIYEFRGADVAVFGVLANRIETEGGRRLYLQRNRRSRPDLLAFFNRFFGRTLRASPGQKEYEVAYEPGDDLLAHRPPAAWAPVERLLPARQPDDAEEARALDAEAVAAHVERLLSSACPVTVDGKAGARSPRGGDIAILLRRFTHLEVFRQALTARGVAHQVWRGRGFHGAEEVVDLVSLLRLVAAPSDAIAWAAVLRSPLIGVDDAGLLLLARAHGERLGRPEDLYSGGWEEALPVDQRERLGRFLRLFRDLRRVQARLGVRALLRVALAETGFVTTMAATTFGEQALANIEKLLEQARRWDLGRGGGAAAFAREMAWLAERDAVEAQADVHDPGDARAVQVLTIHQAKGLEWPIVLVPELGVVPRPIGPKIAFDRHHGLVVRPWIGDPEACKNAPRYRRVIHELSRRQQAESVRLLYVALTRARDRLVLSGAPAGKGREGTWWALLDAALLEDAELRARVVDVPAQTAVAAKPAEQSPLGTDGRDRVEAIDEVAVIDEVVARVRRPRHWLAERPVFSVSAMVDFAKCPRRHRWVHELGLAEPGGAGGAQVPSVAGGAPPDAARDLGTLVHRLLERLPLPWPGSTDDARLARVIDSEGVDPDGPEGRQARQCLARFLATSFARSVGAAGPDAVRREVPFMLRLPTAGGSAFLRGQIDLLWTSEHGPARVVDYKLASPRGAGPDEYSLQLDCYALAAMGLLETPKVETGIVFLRDEPPEPRWRAAAPGPDELRARLGTVVEELLGARSGDEPAGRTVDECRSLRCGFLRRCHGATL